RHPDSIWLPWALLKIATKFGDESHVLNCEHNSILYLKIQSVPF
ncbi:MAG: hypothetical protein ACI8XV_002215, partial [Arenicella sp.]